MNQHILARELLNYIKNLLIDQNLNEWIFKGKTEIAYGSPNGGWDGINGYLFDKSDKSFRFIIRSIPNQNAASYIVIESLNLKGQLYNMDLSNSRICREDQENTYLLESYRMTVGKGKKKEKEVENTFKSFGINSNEVSLINNLNPDWSKTLIDILEWAILREKVKKNLRENNKVIAKINLKEDFINWMIANVSGGNYFEKQFSNNRERFEKEINEYEVKYKENFSSELFIINATNYENEIELLRTNLYNTFNQFSEYSNNNASGRPKAILGNKNYLKFLNDYFTKTKSMENNTNKIQFPLNQILYGPPGTGKTYNTILEAAKIITGNLEISYYEALNVFNSNLDNQIEFITFHQNYSYEDFIQGLRPDTENGSVLTFEKKDGVFKRIADQALKNLEASKNPASVKKEFDLVFQDLIKPLSDGDVEEVEIKMKKSSFFITEVGEKSIDFRKSIGDSEHTLSINTLRKMYDKGVNDLILGGLQPYYNPILELLLEKGKNQVIAVPRKNYVIIIDEINRANISRVFGELITLIEEDKRSEGVIPLKVTLPSGDKFIVPSNLYIIGTMNTADKSIALLDIALRRRFEFKPMYPEVSLVKTEYQDLFMKMNKAIKDKKNHDFTIGHAYFMDNKLSLEQILNNKVIPLLLEYFMNSEEQVIEIMASAGVKIDGWPLKTLV